MTCDTFEAKEFSPWKSDENSKSAMMNWSRVLYILERDEEVVIRRDGDVILIEAKSEDVPKRPEKKAA